MYLSRVIFTITHNFSYSLKLVQSIKNVCEKNLKQTNLKEKISAYKIQLQYEIALKEYKITLKFPKF